MPTEKAKKRARKQASKGNAPTTQAGEFVREEMDKMKQGGGRAKSRKQAIAIGLSEARREGVALPPPKKGVSAATRKKALQDSRRGAAKRSAITKSSGKRASAKKTAGSTKRAAKKR